MKILLLLNGSGGRTSQTELACFQARLDRLAPGSRAHITSSADEARCMAASAAQNGFEQVWIGGGDGTIHGVLAALVECGLPFGVLPRGTVNALARSLGIPPRWDEAFDWLIRAKPVPMNLGQVNGERHFLCFAGIGFDAAVVHAVTGRFKKVGGRMAYALAGARNMFGRDSQPRFEATFDEKTSLVCSQTSPEQNGIHDAGHSLMISQVPLYAGFNLFPGTSPCGQPMEAWLFRRGNASDILRQAAMAAVRNRRIAQSMNYGQNKPNPNVGHYRTCGFTLSSDFPLLLHLDGDPVVLENPNRLVFSTIEGAISALTCSGFQDKERYNADRQI